MYGDGYTTWQLGAKWVCQLRYVSRDGSVKKYQRRRDSRSAAIAAIKEIEKDLNERRSPVSSKCLADYVDEYIDYKLNTVQANTAADYKHQLKLYVLPALGRKNPNEIRAKDIIALLQGLSEKGLSPATVNTVKVRLSTFMEYLVLVDSASENPCKKVKGFRTSTSLVQRPWSLDEVLRAIEASKSGPLELFLHLAIFLGARKGEILALRWSDVNLEEGWLQIDKTRSSRRLIGDDGAFVYRDFESNPKTFAGFRRLPLSGELLVALMNERSFRDSQNQSVDLEDFLVRGVKGEKLALSSLTRAFNRLCQDNHLRRIRVHDLRHTAIVQALEAGARLEEVSQGAGHASTEVTKRIYAPYVPALAAGFATALSQRLGGHVVTPTGSFEGVG